MRLQGTSNASELYAGALADVFQHNWIIYDPDFAQQKDVDIWRKMQRDAKVAQAMDTRRSKVAPVDWSIEAGADDDKSDALAKVVEDALKEIDQFCASRRKLAQSIFRARSYGFVEGRRRQAALGEVSTASWWVPTKIQDIDKRRVEIDATEFPRVKKNLHTIDREHAEGKWVEITPEDPLIELIYDDEEDRLGYGRPLLESVYFLWWAKQICFREGLQGLERWARGTVVGTKGRSNKAGAQGRSGDEVQTAFLDSLKKMQADHVIVVEEGDSIDVKTGGAEGSQIVMNMIKYLDDSILGRITGSILPSGGGQDKGSLARAEVEQETSDELLRFDRGFIDEAITKQLIKRFLHYNRSTLVKLGLGDAACPRFVTKPTKEEDTEKNARVIAALSGSGVELEVEEEDLYRAVGFQRPKPGAKTVKIGGRALGSSPFGQQPGRGLDALIPGRA